MGHLLYSSNEMYSSTELIRKSKTIFDKIINEEIDKAIILRDGKPSFMLLDFDKYEKIMAEYDKLKSSGEKIKTTKKPKKKKVQKIEKTEEVVVEEAKEIIIKEKKPAKKINSAKVVPPSPTFEIDDYQDEKFNIEEPTNEIEEDIVEEEDLVAETFNKDDVKEGMEILEGFDFDDEFKKEVERKVREKKKQELKEFWG